MTAEPVCQHCGELIPEDQPSTVPDDLDLCEKCSAEKAQSPDGRANADRRARWIAVGVGLAGAAAALIGGTIARQREGADQTGRIDDDDDDDDDDDGYNSDDDLDEFDDYICDGCDEKAWVHYCPECHRMDA